MKNCQNGRNTYCCKYGMQTSVVYYISKDNTTIKSATSYDVCGTLTKPPVNNGTTGNSTVITNNGTMDDAGNSTLPTNGTTGNSTVYVNCYYDEFNVAETLSIYMPSSNWEIYSGLLWPFGIGMCIWGVVSIVAVVCASMVWVCCLRSSCTDCFVADDEMGAYDVCYCDVALCVKWCRERWKHPSWRQLWQLYCGCSEKEI